MEINQTKVNIRTEILTEKMDSQNVTQNAALGAT